MANRIFSLVILFVLIPLVGCQPQKETESAKNSSPKKPNVVIIFTDDQGYQDVGCYGSPDIRTPHLDKMAKEGSRFTNFYVSQPVCSASRSSLMTGCYPSRLGIMGALGPSSKTALHPDEVTLAEVLKPEGYATAIYGKWHLGSTPGFFPKDQGFDDYFGLPYSNDMWPYHPEGFDFPDLPLIEGTTVIDSALKDQSQLTTWYTERAVSFIEKNKEEPFFLYLAHSMPHVPLFVSDKFKGKSPRGLYGDVIEEIDWSVGQVLSTLKRLGLDENTIVIFTSDNGPWLSYGDHAGDADPLREGKGTVWDGGVRVPCIMRWPGQIPAGQVIEEAAMTIDVLPTIAGITGGKLPNHTIDGIDIWPVLQGKEMTPRDAFYFYYKSNELHAVLSGDGRWKLYVPHTYRSMSGRPGGTGGMPTKYDYGVEAGQELYDLRNDISETTDVSKQHPEIVTRLLAEVEKAREELGDKLTDRVGKGVRAVGRVN